MDFSEREILEEFEKLGLTKYESKAYLVLLSNGSSYGGEISKKSGVPGAKIYETLDRLVEKGLAYPVSENPVHYRPLPLENFLNNKRHEFQRSIEYLKSNLNKISKIDSSELFWFLSGKDTLMDKTKEFINNAKSNILISLWPEEAKELKEPLYKAYNRNVEIIILMFDNIEDIDFGKIYKHYMFPAAYERHSSEMFLFVDNSCGMFMFLEEYYGWKGFYTYSKGISRVIENYIKHDIYINKVINENTEFITEKYGKHLERLLDI